MIEISNDEFGTPLCKGKRLTMDMLINQLGRTLMWRREKFE